MSEVNKRRAIGVGRYAWVASLVVGVAVAFVANFVLPEGHGSLDPLYLGLLFVESIAVLVGIVMWKPPRAVRRGWLVLAVSMGLYFAGDVMWVWYARRGIDPFPSPADAFFIAGTLGMIIGAMLLVAARREVADRATQLDTLIVAVAAGTLLWVLSVEPYAVDGSISSVEQFMSGVFPMLDVLLAAVIARLLLGGGRIPTGFVLLLAGILAWTVTDIVYYQQEILGTYVEWGWVDFGYMIGFVLTGSSALHPAAARVAEVPERPAELGAWRLALLAVVGASPLVVIGIAGPLDLDVNITVLTAGGIILIALVVARTWTLIAVQRELGTLRGHARFTSLVKNASDTIVVIGDDLTVTYASPALSAQWGWAESDLLGQSIERLIGSGGAEQVTAWIATVMDAETVESLDCEWRDVRGGTRAVSMVVSDLRNDPDIEGIVITGRDVSQRALLENQLRHEAGHDGLTGLVNRSTFNRKLEQQLRANVSSTSVAFVDVDDFKDINDGLGHAIGDQVLRVIAARLAEHVRPGDLVARLGGDEFGIMLTDATPTVTATMADRLNAAFDRPLDLGSEELRVSVSVGWYDVDPAVDAETAIRNSDLAMYRAKRSGKGRAAHYHTEMLDDVERRLDLRTRLATAIENDELHIAYQTIVRVADGTVTGKEALLRWNPGDGAFVSPAEFIPLAEETGDIVAIGSWVLHQACRDAVGWLENEGGVAPIVSVNVSAKQLEYDFTSTVALALTASGLPPDRLQLELTETLMARQDAAQEFQQLAQLGVRLAIDDFGTGYCSLGYLQQFSVDVIKIDQQLVSGAATDPRLLAGVAGLINAVGSVAVAEGIETLEDNAAVVALGIPLGQGFLWDTPTRQSAPSPERQTHS